MNLYVSYVFDGQTNISFEQMKKDYEKYTNDEKLDLTLAFFCATCFSLL